MLQTHALRESQSSPSNQICCARIDTEQCALFSLLSADNERACRNERWPTFVNSLVSATNLQFTRSTVARALEVRISPRTNKSGCHTPPVLPGWQNVVAIALLCTLNQYTAREPSHALHSAPELRASQQIKLTDRDRSVAVYLTLNSALSSESGSRAVE